jgi:hypothetical protein
VNWIYLAQDSDQFINIIRRSSQYVGYEWYSQQFPKFNPDRLRNGTSVTDDREKRQERDVRETERKTKISTTLLRA